MTPFLRRLKNIGARLKNNSRKNETLKNNAMRVYRCFGGVTETCFPVSDVKNVSDFSKTLVQRSSFVGVDGNVYDLTQDGVYRFYKLPAYSEQRVVCDGSVSSALNSIGLLWQYGNRDDGLNVDSCKKIATKRTLVISCTAQAEVARDVLREFGIGSRVVLCITEEAWNGQDDGHTLLEVQGEDGRWFVYDPSFALSFPNNSLFDLCLKNKVLPYAQSLPGNSGNGGFEACNYNYAFWVEERLLSDQALEAWYGRVLNVPMICEDNHYYYPIDLISKKNRKVFEDSYYKGLSKEEFLGRFYNN